MLKKQTPFCKFSLSIMMVIAMNLKVPKITSLPKKVFRILEISVWILRIKISLLTSFLSDFGPRQIENAAMLCSSWQRPPMMIDPNGEGSVWLGKLNKLMNKKKLVSLDMETRCVRAN